MKAPSWLPFACIVSPYHSGSLLSGLYAPSRLPAPSGLPIFVGPSHHGRYLVSALSAPSFMPFVLVRFNIFAGFLAVDGVEQRGCYAFWGTLSSALVAAICVCKVFYIMVVSCDLLV